MITAMDRVCVLGIDLAGVPHRPTGMCVLKNRRAETFLAASDEDIVSVALDEHPVLIAIDAPLRLPPGRRSIHERNDSHYRPCDLELRRRKIPFFPVTLGPMRVLTERGMALAQKLETMGFRCVEIYPGGAQDVWGIPRAKRDIVGLREGLKGLGIEGLRPDASDHELDAATGALVGLLFLEGKAEVLGNDQEGAILLPQIIR